MIILVCFGGTTILGSLHFYSLFSHFDFPPPILSTLKLAACQPEKMDGFPDDFQELSWRFGSISFSFLNHSWFCFCWTSRYESSRVYFNILESPVGLSNGRVKEPVFLQGCFGGPQKKWRPSNDGFSSDATPTSCWNGPRPSEPLRCHNDLKSLPHHAWQVSFFPGGRR